MSKLSALTALSSMSADDLVAIINDPSGAHTARSAILERIAAVTAGLTEATAADLSDDDLALIIQDPSGAADAQKITLADLGLILQNATAQLFPTDRWYYECWPRSSASIDSSMVTTGNTHAIAGGYSTTPVGDAYGGFVRWTGPSTLSFARVGNPNFPGNNIFQFLYCSATKFYANWRIRPLRDNNTWIWLIFVNEDSAPSSWTPADGLLGRPVVGFTFAHNAGTLTSQNWWTIMGDAGSNVRADTGVAIDTVAPMLFEVESNDDCTSIEFRINGSVVDTRNSGLPTSALSPIMLAGANGAGNGGFDFFFHRAWRVPRNGLWPKCEP